VSCKAWPTGHQRRKDKDQGLIRCRTTWGEQGTFPGKPNLRPKSPPVSGSLPYSAGGGEGVQAHFGHLPAQCGARAVFCVGLSLGRERQWPREREASATCSDSQVLPPRAARLALGGRRAARCAWEGVHTAPGKVYISGAVHKRRGPQPLASPLRGLACRGIPLQTSSPSGVGHSLSSPKQLQPWPTCSARYSMLRSFLGCPFILEGRSPHGSNLALSRGPAVPDLSGGSGCKGLSVGQWATHGRAPAALPSQ